MLVDTPPELRIQLLRAKISQLDSVYLTHLHADHVHGIDDLRIFSLRAGAAVPIYVAEEHANELRTRFNYIFDDAIQPDPGTSSPEINLHTFAAGDRLSIAGFEMQVLASPHGNVSSYGFRVGPLGVVVDGKTITRESRKVLEGVEVLVINALWWGKPHPTHFNVEEAVAAANSLGAKRTFLTHLTHRLDYRELADRLPSDVTPAYDGLVIDIP
jgi:phosphoribosyl 1,2-cyclic phosphate phosphodiesterase